MDNQFSLEKVVKTLLEIVAVPDPEHEIYIDPDPKVMLSELSQLQRENEKLSETILWRMKNSVYYNCPEDLDFEATLQRLIEARAKLDNVVEEEERLAQNRLRWSKLYEVYTDRYGIDSELSSLGQNKDAGSSGLQRAHDFREQLFRETSHKIVKSFKESTQVPLPDGVVQRLTEQYIEKQVDDWFTSKSKYELSEYELSEENIRKFKPRMLELCRQVAADNAASEEHRTLSYDELSTKVNEFNSEGFRGSWDVIHAMQNLSDFGPQVQKTIGFLMDSPAVVKQEKKNRSLKYVADILQAIDNDHLPVASETIENFIEQIVEQGRKEEFSEFIAGFGYQGHKNLPGWRVLREDEYVKCHFGDELLDEIRSDIGEKMVNHLISPDSTDVDKIKMTKVASYFATVKTAPLVILNFCRGENGLSYRPALDNYKINRRFSRSFDETQIKEIERNAPGAGRFIDIMSKYPGDILFSGCPEIFDDDTCKIEDLRGAGEALHQLSMHYLRNGTNQERLFTLENYCNNFMREMSLNCRGNDYDRVLNADFGLSEENRHQNRRRNDLFDVLTELMELTGDDRAQMDKFQSLFLRRLHGVNTFISGSDVDRSIEGIANEFRQLVQYSHDLEKILEHSSNPTELLAEEHEFEYDNIYGTKNLESVLSIAREYLNNFERINTSKTLNPLKKFVKDFAHRIAEKVDYSPCHQGIFKAFIDAIDDPETSSRLQSSNSRDFVSIVESIYTVSPALVTPLLRGIISREISDRDLYFYFGKLKWCHEQFDDFIDYARKNPKGTIDTLLTLHADRRKNCDWSNGWSFEEIVMNHQTLEKSGFKPTPYLLSQVMETESKKDLFNEWNALFESFKEGKFNAKDELHVNLEYTRFRRIVDHEKLKKHIKNHFTLKEYFVLFEKPSAQPPEFDEQQRFEIDCVAHEATLLKKYIGRIKEKAEEQDKNVIVIPNLSYGYLPFSSLVDELTEEGVGIILGAKVGSTESHDNKQAVNSRLFKGNRTEIANKRPVLLVVDGTYNLVSINNRNKSARYPDAYQGYLNQVIALNDAIGCADEDYSHVGKTEEDLKRLRETPEFNRTVDVYRHVTKDDSKNIPYRFELWNTAGIELAIRGEREIVSTVRPYDGDVKQPTMIFCNIGVLDEQIPAEIKEKYPGQEHKPAYYDDSGKILNFDFGYDEYGVRYLNRLEAEVRKAYQKMNEKDFEIGTEIPALIGCLNLQQTAHYEKEAY